LKITLRPRLIIVHQDELEDELTSQFQERDPSVIGNDYLILGTVEQKVWRERRMKLCGSLIRAIRYGRNTLPGQPKGIGLLA